MADTRLHPLDCACWNYRAPKWENARLMSASSTGDDRAMNILRELHAAEKELVGRAVVLTDGTIDQPLPR
jgi:hypothetical protein